MISLAPGSSPLSWGVTGYALGAGYQGDGWVGLAVNLGGKWVIRKCNRGKFVIITHFLE